MEKSVNNCPFCKQQMSTHLLPRHFQVKHQLTKNEAIKLRIELQYPLVNWEEVIKAYLKGESAPAVAQKWKIPSNVVDKILYLSSIGKRTLKESHKTLQYEEAYLTTIREHYNVNNPSQNEDIKKKKRETSLRTTGFANRFCDPVIQKKANMNAVLVTWTPEWREKYYQTLSDKYGVDNVSKVKEISKKMAESLRSRAQKMTADERRSLTEKMRAARFALGPCSKLELKISEILDDLNLEYVRNSKVLQYFVDFVFNKKTVLEIQGDFWHANPSKYKAEDLMPVMNLTASQIWERDARKKQDLEKNGYKVFYLWESDINKNPFTLIIKTLKEIVNEELRDSKDREN